jgi:hypothetical protein
MTAVIRRTPLDWAKTAFGALRSSVGTGDYPGVAEAKDVKFFAIGQQETAAGRVLHIDGLVFHSALAVDRVDHEQHGDAVIVEVKLTPSLKGRSGSFVADIPLRADTREVLFGPDRALIWERPAEY